MIRKLAVIIPVYNQERHLDECLTSVFTAAKLVTVPFPLSVICVNDGSTDGSARILARYRAVHADLQVLDSHGRGVSAARNAGIEFALSDQDVTHLMFLDSDDAYSPEVFEKVRQAEEGADIVQFDFDAVDDDGRFVRSYDNLGTNVWGRCFRRDTIGEVRFFTGTSSAEDIAFNQEVGFRSHPKIVRLHDSLYRYRQVSGSEMHRPLTAEDFDRLMALIEYLVSVYSADLAALDVFARTELFDLLKQFYRQLRRVSAAELPRAKRVFFLECAALRGRGLLHPRRGRPADLRYYLRFMFFGRFLSGV